MKFIKIVCLWVTVLILSILSILYIPTIVGPYTTMFTLSYHEILSAAAFSILNANLITGIYYIKTKLDK